MRILLLFCFLLSGCWVPHYVYEVPDGVRLSVAGGQGNLLSVYVNDEGFRLTLWFDILAKDECGELKYKETIQRLRANNMPDGWEGVETHRQGMWIPDFQTFTRYDTGPRYVRRENTVSPGRTKDTPWCTLPGIFKGVCMISGCLDENGEPIINRTYFNWGGKQGGEIIEEAVELGITYTIEWWTSDHPDNPNFGKATLRLTVPIANIKKEWTDEG